MRPELLTLLKAHCRVDYDDDDALLQWLYKTAVKYLLKAGIQEDAENEEYQLLAFSLVLEWYEQGSTAAVTVGLRQLINQYKFDAVAESDEPMLRVVVSILETTGVQVGHRKNQ